MISHLASSVDSEHRASVATYVSKEAVPYYQNRHSNVLIAFLDSEKNFSRIRHERLLLKLFPLGVKGRYGISYVNRIKM